MKRRILTIIEVLVIAAMVSGFAVLAVHTRRECAKYTCTDMEVLFNDSLKFVSSEDVRKLVEKGCGSFVGRRIDSMQLCEIEKKLLEEDVITECEAWATYDGMLHVAISQRVPILMFCPDKGENFYIDAEGFIFKLRPPYAPDVPVIHGCKPDGEKWIEGTLDLIQRMDKHPKWKNADAKLSMDRTGDITLKCGTFPETFIFGQPLGNGLKLDLIDKYIKEIKPLGHNYTSVNVKYSKQIVCRKDI